MSTAHPIPTSEPAPLAAADLADANGWRDPAALAVPDTVMLGTLADWGICRTTTPPTRASRSASSSPGRSARARSSSTSRPSS